MQPSPPVQTPLGALLSMIGVVGVVVGFVVLALGVWLGTLFVVGGAAAVLVGFIRTWVAQTPAALPGVPVCFACGGRLSWEGLSGRWWCPSCSAYR